MVFEDLQLLMPNADKCRHTPLLNLVVAKAYRLLCWSCDLDDVIRNVECVLLLFPDRRTSLRRFVDRAFENRY